MADKEYTKQWTGAYKYTLKACLRDLKDQPVKYLEIGVFEGRSMHMMMHHVLCHPEARAWGIDPWTIEAMNRRRYPDNEQGHGKIGEVERKARANLAEYSDKLTIIKAKSQEYLAGKPFNEEFFDIIYIDGIHKVYGCLQDTVLTWPLLKVGGICIWDDYSKPYGVGPAADGFLGMIPEEHEVLHRAGQLAVRKLKSIDW